MVHVKVIGLILVLIVLNMFDSCSSCVMDRYYSYYVKNCTNDTLLIDVSGVDTLRDWKYWNEQVQDICQLTQRRIWSSIRRPLVR